MSSFYLLDPGSIRFRREHSLELNGNPNALTIDIGTSELAQGPSAQTCLVEIEKADEKDINKRVEAKLTRKIETFGRRALASHGR